jgi:hypothetical protein
MPMANSYGGLYKEDLKWILKAFNLKYSQQLQNIIYSGAGLPPVQVS